MSAYDPHPLPPAISGDIPIASNEELQAPARVLIASSGREDTLAVLRAGALLARQLGDGAELVVVFEPRVPLPTVPSDGDVARLDDPWQRHEAHRMVDRVRAERERVALEFPEAAHWPIHLEVGDPPAKIARTAQHCGASIIVAGAGHHGDSCAGQVARRLMYLVDVPLLVVPAECHLPFSGVAVDVGMGVAGMRVARAAMRLLAPDGELHLVSVTPGTGRAVQGIAEDVGNGMADPDRLRHRLGARPELQVHAVRLDGDPARQVLSYAEQLGVPVVATAIEGHTPTERSLLRNLGPALLRERSSAVLLVPPTVVPREEEVQPVVVGALPASRPGTVGSW